MLLFGTDHAAYLCIMMLEVPYVQHFNDPIQPPINPGEYPDDIPANASTLRRIELIFDHKASKLVYDTFKAVTQCFWNQFQEAINEDYLAELYNPDVGRINVHPSIIYQYIVDRYAKIKHFNASMDPSKPLAVYTEKAGMLSSVFCWCWQSNQNGEHGANGLTHAVATGVMHDAYQEWKHIPKLEIT